MRDRECYKIGDRIDKIRRKQSEMDSFQDNPLGEMHISVARIRLSKADATKFRIFTGIKKGGKGNFGWRGALQGLGFGRMARPEDDRPPEGHPPDLSQLVDTESERAGELASYLLSDG